MTRGRRKIYLDYAATTPVDPRVVRAMQPYWNEKFGNAGSLHSFGQNAIAAVDCSREAIARDVGAGFRDIIFTASATEANNLALQIVCGVSGAGNGKKNRPRIIVSSIEHESVIEAARNLERRGVDLVYLPVDDHGVVNLKKLQDSISERTVLISVMYVNNEIGTVQPIREIADIVKKIRTSYPVPHCPYPILHSDASQAFDYFDCNVDDLGVDMMTLSSHKIYGPKGAAALYVRALDAGRRNSAGNAPMQPLLFGGGQEFGLRPGTENVPAIVGFAKAAEIAAAMREKEFKRVAALRDYFWREIKKIYPQAQINGIEASLGPRAQGIGPTSPHILNIYFPGRDAQDILTQFDLAGVAASSGSACRSRAFESSYVIEALGYSKERAKSSIRFSFGRQTTIGDLRKTIGIIKAILRR